MKLWGGRFTAETDKAVEAFTASIHFDRRMYAEDICGSIVHAEMLAKENIITQTDKKDIIEGLKKIYSLIEQDEFEFSDAAEDIHMSVEQKLTDMIGEGGKRLHTGRSRNDQVALDTHLYVRKAVTRTGKLLLRLQNSLLEAAKRYEDVIMPGYTHLQRAQPILFSHHMMAYFAMLSRDFKYLSLTRDLADMMPLGAGALAGTTWPLDQAYVAKRLKFTTLYENSLDAVSDRDYIIAFLEFGAQVMMHLSRLSEEYVLWSSAEFAFIELDDSHCTGSSIMPQKKNPDICELVRGKTGRFYGHLMALLTVMKGLPLAYNKDMQEDKEGLFDAVDNLHFALSVYADMIDKMTVCKDRMRTVLEGDFSDATDMADYLVRQGLPFREAHAVTGHAVRYCIEHGKVLKDLNLEELRTWSSVFSDDVYEALQIEACVRGRKTYSGTAPESVARQCTDGESLLKSEEAQILAWENTDSHVYAILK